MTGILPLTSTQLDEKVLHHAGVVALDFYQASCSPCHALEPRLAAVATQFAGIVPVYRVDIDRDLSLAERFGVMSIPTVLIFRSGAEIERLDGLITQQQLAAAFAQAISS